MFVCVRLLGVVQFFLLQASCLHLARFSFTVTQTCCLVRSAVMNVSGSQGSQRLGAPNKYKSLTPDFFFFFLPVHRFERASVIDENKVDTLIDLGGFQICQGCCFCLAVEAK